MFEQLRGLAIVSAIALVGLGAPLHAQQAVFTRGPSVYASTAALPAPASSLDVGDLTPAVALPQSRGGGISKPAVLMIVGAAALITGAVIDGDEGTIIMIAGAGIGLYGLYAWLSSP
ncbi:MAG: hypothetical protein ACRENI_13565 [Gemmatimonadaceae bacterium]